MALDYKNLDARTRELMLHEIEHDIREKTLYLSDNLNDQGRRDYPDLLRQAASSGTDETFAEEIRTRLHTHERPRRLPSGGFSKPPVMRVNAHEMLAEGEFNRFYIRALCLRAIADGVGYLIIYRAKAVLHARSESQQKIGQSVPAQTLLQDLRTHPGVDTALGLPPGPNSGLSARVP